MNDQELRSRLEGTEQANYDGNYPEHLLEQYKLYVDMADRISQRRQSAHGFFLTVNTGLIAFLGWSLIGGKGVLDPILFIVVAVVGIVLSASWYMLMRSYLNLNTAKFEVINLMEGYLPVRPYGAEWYALGEGHDASRYRPFTKIESLIPGAFGLLHLALLAIAILHAINVL